MKRKKLVLKKDSIAKLSESEMSEVKGGDSTPIGEIMCHSYEHLNCHTSPNWNTTCQPTFCGACP